MPHLHTRPGECDVTVTGYVVAPDREHVLMHMHRKLGLWLAPGGHIEWNQTPLEALYDEIEQEAGIGRGDLELIDTNPLQHRISRASSEMIPTPFDIDVHPIPTPDSSNHRHIDMAYALRSATVDVRPAPGESQTWEWMDESRLYMIAEQTSLNSLTRSLLALRLARGER